MKNIDVIRNASEEELVEILHEQEFECDGRCSDFGNGCFGTCKHDCGREFIREWLNEENKD